EDEVMAARGTHPEMVPRLNVRDARRAVRDHKPADAGVVACGPCPHDEVTQDGATGRVELMAGEPPTARRRSGSGCWQSAARGRAELRLSAHHVDQRHAVDRFPPELVCGVRVPCTGERGHRTVDVVHCEHERGGWLARRYPADDPARGREALSQAAG